METRSGAAKWRKWPCVRPATMETGFCSSGGVWHTTKQRKQTSYGRNMVLLIGRGVAYRKTEETDLCWSATVETGVLFIGRGVAYRKMGLHGLLFIHRLLPRSSLHGLLFMHHRPPLASTYDCSSTASPSCLQQLLFIHGLLFIQPPPLLHWLLFNHPSMGYYSTSPPPATVQPVVHGVLFIHPQPARVWWPPQMGSCSSSSSGLLLLPWGPVHPTPTRNCSSNRQQRSLFIKTQQV